MEYLLIQKQAYGDNQWNFPGGGIDTGELADSAIMRELEEELGTNKFTIISRSKNKMYYDWPDFVIKKRYSEKHELFRGQETIHFYIEYLGTKSEIKIDKKELKKSKWVKLLDLENYLIFDNQWRETKQVLKEFGLL